MQIFIIKTQRGLALKSTAFIKTEKIVKVKEKDVQLN